MRIGRFWPDLVACRPEWSARGSIPLLVHSVRRMREKSRREIERRAPTVKTCVGLLPARGQSVGWCGCAVFGVAPSAVHKPARGLPNGRREVRGRGDALSPDDRE